MVPLKPIIYSKYNNNDNVLKYIIMVIARKKMILRKQVFCLFFSLVNKCTTIMRGHIITGAEEGTMMSVARRWRWEDGGQMRLSFARAWTRILHTHSLTHTKRTLNMSSTLTRACSTACTAWGRKGVWLSSGFVLLLSLLNVLSLSLFLTG